MDGSTPCQKRRSSRSQVLLTAELEHDGACFSVKLRNLSSEGALVENAKLPIEGTQVEFRRQGTEHHGPGRLGERKNMPASPSKRISTRSRSCATSRRRARRSSRVLIGPGSCRGTWLLRSVGLPRAGSAARPLPGQAS